MTGRVAVLAALAAIGTGGLVAIRLVAARRWARRSRGSLAQGFLLHWWRERLGIPVRILFPLWLVAWIAAFVWASVATR